MFALLLLQNNDQNIHELSVPVTDLDEHASYKLFNASIYKVLESFQERCFPNDINDVSLIFMYLTVNICGGTKKGGCSV